MSSHAVLPFRFLRLDDTRTLVVNEAEEFLALGDADFAGLTQHDLPADSGALLDRRGSAARARSLPRAASEDRVAGRRAEPTLFRDGLLELIARCEERLPSTALHVLTTGRLFLYRPFAARLDRSAHLEASR